MSIHEPQDDIQPEPSPVTLASVIAEAIRDVAARGCEHNWDILDVQDAPEPAVRLPMAASIAVTYVLVRCALCGIPDALTLQGTWTLEQVAKTIGEAT